MITVPRTLKTKPKKVSNQESDIQWLTIDKYFLDLSQNQLGLDGCGRLSQQTESAPVIPGALARRFLTTGDLQCRSIVTGPAWINVCRW